MKKISTNKIFAIVIIALIIIILLITLISSNKTSVIQMPTSSEINEIIQNENITIIDVRTKEEYNTGHIKGSINIPENEIKNKINYSKDTPIAVYCRTGKRSHNAALALEKMGYTQIYDLGGIENSNIELTTD